MGTEREMGRLEEQYACPILSHRNGQWPGLELGLCSQITSFLSGQAYYGQFICTDLFFHGQV